MMYPSISQLSRRRYSESVFTADNACTWLLRTIVSLWVSVPPGEDPPGGVGGAGDGGASSLGRNGPISQATSLAD